MAVRPLVAPWRTNEDWARRAGRIRAGRYRCARRSADCRPPGGRGGRGPSASGRLDRRTAVEPQERLGAEYRGGPLIVVALSDDHPVRRWLGMPTAHDALHPVPFVGEPRQD